MLSALYARWFRDACLSVGIPMADARRQCSARMQPELVDGLLLLSYPLHPPRKPEQLRVQHLPKLHTPALFVHGTRDPFGTAEELESALKLIPAKVRFLRIEGAGHDLGFKGKANQDELPAVVLKEFRALFG